MQRIKIDLVRNELKNIYNTVNNGEVGNNEKNSRIGKFWRIKNGRITELNGILNNRNDNENWENTFENREPNSKLKYEFIKRYINEKWVKFCPYCWKNYLTYFCNEVYKRNNENYKKWDCKPNKIISWFDIEHFFPKGYVNRNWNRPYVHLAKNLYNWHLSCLICNQRLKKDRDVLEGASKEEPIFNPYFWWIYKDWDEIKVDDSTFDDKVTFVWEPDPRFDNRRQVFKTYHWKFFRLWEIYLNDEETYNIFNFIYDKYTKIKDEYHRFKKTSKTIEEFVEYFFKNYYPKKEEDILKYSNWKFKKDLIEYMKKILEKIEENWRSNGN